MKKTLKKWWFFYSLHRILIVMVSNKKFKKKILILNTSTLIKGYRNWKFSFTGYHKVTGEPKSFFIEYFIVNPSKKNPKIILGQTDAERLFNSNSKGTIKPSYAMIKAGAFGDGSKQIQNYYSTADVFINKKQHIIQIKDSHISDASLFGYAAVSSFVAASHPEYLSDSGSMSWILKFDKQVSFNPYTTSCHFG